METTLVQKALSDHASRKVEQGETIESLLKAFYSSSPFANSPEEAKTFLQAGKVAYPPYKQNVIELKIGYKLISVDSYSYPQISQAYVYVITIKTA